jgi:DNA-binding transcriptional regulator YhcF (GntR family)
MRNVFEHIQELDDMPSYTKHDQLVEGIINAINDKSLVPGDMLPSVNVMIKEVGFARETIVKGYKDLIGRGLIESRNRLGYFVLNSNTDQSLKVALVMYAIDAFQEQFYRSFRKELGKNIHLDLFFHHGNIDMCETILNMIKGKYGMYVVAPIPHPKTKQLLAQIPLNKFLMVDRYELIDGDFNHVTQEFEESSYRAFAELADAIRKFKEIIFFHRPGSLIPIEIVRAFKKFLKDFSINGKMMPAYIPGSLKKGVVYFSIDNMEIWEILKDCKKKSLQLGKDVGLLTHNDEPVKEIIFDGLTTYSASFTLMGERAGRAVAARMTVKETIPTVLIRRNSL